MVWLRLGRLLAGLLLASAMPIAGAQTPFLDEFALLDYIGVRPSKSALEREDGCAVKRYVWGRGIDEVKLDLKCSRVALSWYRYRPTDKRQSAKLVERLAEYLGQDVPIEVAGVQELGKVYKGRLAKSGLSISGSCVPDVCVLTYSDK